MTLGSGYSSKATASVSACPSPATSCTLAGPGARSGKRHTTAVAETRAARAVSPPTRHNTSSSALASPSSVTVVPPAAGPRVGEYAREGDSRPDREDSC